MEMKKDSREGKIFMELAEFVYNYYHDMLLLPREGFKNFFDFKRHLFKNEDVEEKRGLLLSGWLGRDDYYRKIGKGKSINYLIDKNKDLENFIDENLKYLLKMGKRLLIIDERKDYRHNSRDTDLNNIDKEESLINDKEEFIKEITR